MPICGRSGYITPAVSGVPNSSERGGKSEVPICGRSGYMTPAFYGVPNAQHGDKIRNGPHLGTLAT